MPVRYKIDVVQALKDKGFSSYRIRKEKILAEATLQALRRGEMVSYATLGKLCALLECQPGDILEYNPDEPSANQF